MLKIVRYNGGNLSYYGCTGDYRKLSRGKLYVVVAEDVRAWQTDYTLRGFKGEFNSVWFDTVLELKLPARLVCSETIPVVGQRYHCRMVSNTAEGSVIRLDTSPVKAVKRIGRDLYLTYTCNSVYLAQVG